MNSARRALIGQGQGEFVEEEIRAYEQSYEELLCKGMDENRKTKLIMQDVYKRQYRDWSIPVSAAMYRIVPNPADCQTPEII